MKVKLVTVTPDAEKTMGYVARVSNPKNQDNDDFQKPRPFGLNLDPCLPEEWDRGTCQLLEQNNSCLD